MNITPLSYVTLMLIIGILVARYTEAPFFIFWIAALLMIVVCVVLMRYKRWFLLFFGSATFFLGASIFRNSEILPANHIFYFSYPKGRAVCIEGTVDTQPISNSRTTTFVLKVRELIERSDNKKVCGKVLVKMFTNKPLSYGDLISIEGTLYKPPSYIISKGVDYREYLIRKGIYSVLSVAKGSCIRLLEVKKGNTFYKIVLDIRSYLKELIKNHFSPFTASILNAVMLGYREDLTNELIRLLVQSGTIHIIAISGLHVGLLTFIVLTILKVLRFPPRLSYIVTCFILIIYCLLTGARTPVVRATIMALIYLFGYIIIRQVNIYNSLSLAALVILLFNPKELFNISFQLSFVSVLSIVLLSPRVKALFGKWAMANLYCKWLVSLFAGSIAAWLGVAPLIAYYFDIVTPIAVLANMLIVPYLAVIIGSGLIFIFTSIICPSVSYIFSTTCEALISILLKFISFLVHIPGGYFYI